MNVIKANRIIDRLNQMIDNAMEGNPIETGFDESKVSALETKLSNYLAVSCVTKSQLTEEKNKINELISDISHQTKTPLANIMLYAQLLSESELSVQDSKLIDALMEQAEKLNFLIESLVKTSRLETGIIAVIPNNNSVEDLINSVIMQVTPKAHAKNIQLSTMKTETFACFDPKWTVEALYNIVDNAIKYTSLDGKVSISVNNYQFFCRIDITDTGIGISEDQTAKIFQRFYRSPCVTDKEGVGIGLYLAREIISTQGGYIKVSSKTGVGSTFSVFLPI